MSLFGASPENTKMKRFFVGGSELRLMNDIKANFDIAIKMIKFGRLNSILLMLKLAIEIKID